MNLENGIYRIKNSNGEFASAMAVQMHSGLGRPVRITNKGNWGFAREAFQELTSEQINKLAEYGLHDNQDAP